ncbi:MAG: ABC transporter substrate-binding protein [Treponemataceae bacterium]|nr:MAG: ABC transporter substrate-binding protein [Treponemataceae bacterium]
MKKAAAVILFCWLAVSFAGALGKNDKGVSGKKPVVVRVSALNGPSAVPMAYLFEHHPPLDGVESTFQVSASPDILLPKMLKGEIDIGILPVNVAAKVFNANNGAVILAAVTGEGMISLVTKDASVTSFASLKGKRVYVSGQGAAPDYMTRYLLASNGIAVGEGPNAVSLDFSIPAAEIAPALISGKIACAVVPEPFSTVIISNNAAFRRAIDFQKEFATLQKDSSYPMTALVVRAEFARNYPKTLRLFLQAMEQAVYWTNAYPQDAGQLVQKHTLGLQAVVAARSIPSSAFKFVNAADARVSVERLLNIFAQNDPASTGGKLPSDGFYFK